MALRGGGTSWKGAKVYEGPPIEEGKEEGREYVVEHASLHATNARGSSTSVPLLALLEEPPK